MKTVRTSAAYVMTLNPLSEKDMAKLDSIRAKISAENKDSSVKRRVVVRNRKPIAKTKVVLRDGTVRISAYDAMGNIVNGRANAKRLDVYVYNR